MRECDNDECEYETGVNETGQAHAWWVHAEDCAGPPEPLDHAELTARAAAQPTSFLAMLLGPESRYR